MANSTLLHITNRETWLNAQRAGSYQADSLASEGFIHCSTPRQIVDTANRYYKGTRGLMLLEIDSTRVKSSLRWENLVGGTDLFPHIYGPLNLDAVVRVTPFEPGPDGLFSQPA
jgi:uncharacterized protein (DUF952 family)